MSPRTASVAIIGGGVVGASVAYHLAKSGMTDVLIIDQGSAPGEGSTCRATGGFRAQFASEVNVKLSLDSRARMLRMAEETGVDPGYEPVGYLWLACSDRQLEVLRSSRAVQKSCGLDEAEEVTAWEAARLNPCVSIKGVVGGAWCPTDGYIQPMNIMRGYFEAATRLGVASMWNTEVLGIESDGADGLLIRTSSDEISAPRVVNAAGPWASEVAKMAGVDLPVYALRRQAAITAQTDAIPASMPMTIYMDTGFHLRARDGHALLCWPTDNDKHDAAPAADDDWLEAVRVMIDQRVPSLRNVSLDRAKSYSGFYEMSPDHHAIVGFAPECPSMFLVNGSSGHGVMHAPALGAAAAEILCGNTPAIDVSPLSPLRFASGELLDSGGLL